MAEKTQGTDSGAPPPRWIMKIVTRVHVAIYRLTGGKMGNKGGEAALAALEMVDVLRQLKGD